jgi:hypothetical protein
MSDRLRFASVLAVMMTVACASTTPVRPRTGATALPPTMNQVHWNPATGTLRCGLGDAELTLEKDLHPHVHVLAPDLVVVVLPHGGSALLVTMSPSYLRGKRAGVLGDLPEIWKELHHQATGVDLRDGDLQGQFRTLHGGITGEYTYGPPPSSFGPSQFDFEPPMPERRLDFDPTRTPQWRLAYVEAGPCRIAAVDRADGADRPRLIPRLDGLRIAPELIRR